MAKFRLFSFFILFVLTVSCRKGAPEIDGFDKQAWEADKNACEDKRKDMVSLLQQNKDKLLALREMEIVSVLGRPDQNELYKRNQKFFYYYLKPAPSCPNGVDSVTSRMVIRFNAMGLSKEISFK